MACVRCGSLVPDTFRTAVLAGRAGWVTSHLSNVGVAAELRQRAVEEDLPPLRFPRGKSGPHIYATLDVCESCAREIQDSPGGTVRHDGNHLVILEPGSEESALEQLQADGIVHSA